MVSSLIAVIFASGVSLFMAWTIGAGSSGSTPFAPAVGANAISTMSAGFYVGLLGLLGASLQGSSVAEAVGSELVVGVTLSPTSVIIALFIAGSLMALGIWKGYPISSAFVVTGAVIGAGLSLGGIPAWSKYVEVILMWTIGPLFGVIASYTLVKLFQSKRVSTAITAGFLSSLITALILNVNFYIPTFGMIPITKIISMEFDKFILRPILTVLVSILVGYYTYTRTSKEPDEFMKKILLVVGSVVAFSAGGSQVGLAVGPLLPISGEIPIGVTGIVIGGGLGILVGSWTGAPRMIKAVSQDYAQLGPRRSVSALTPAFVLAQTAILFGVPISFNQMIVSCIVGAGLGSKGSSDDSVGKKKMLLTIGAWIGTLFASFILTYVTVHILTIFIES